MPEGCLGSLSSVHHSSVPHVIAGGFDEEVTPPAAPSESL